MESVNVASNVSIALSSVGFHFGLCQVRFNCKVSLGLQIFSISTTFKGEIMAKIIINYTTKTPK